MPLTDIMYLGRIRCTDLRVLSWSIGGEQWDHCEPSESTWQISPVKRARQALMIRDDYDISHLGVDIDNIGPDWDYLECPEDSLEYTVVSEYQGISDPPGHGKSVCWSMATISLNPPGRRFLICRYRST